MRVHGGSSAAVVGTAAFLTTAGAPVPSLRDEALDRAVRFVVDVVKRRDVEPTFLRKRLQQSPAAALFTERAHESGHELFAFACRNHIGEQRQRLRVHERDRAANHDEGIAGGSRPARTGTPARRSIVSMLV